MPRTESRLPSQERLDEFLQLARAGNYVQTVCAYTGISERAVYAWLREAEDPDARPRVVQFVPALREARAFAEAAMVQVVTRAAHSGDWRAAGFFLERSAPKRWGPWDRVELDLASTPEPAVSNRDQLAAALVALAGDLMDDELAAEAVPAPAPAGVITSPARSETA